MRKIFAVALLSALAIADGHEGADATPVLISEAPSDPSVESSDPVATEEDASAPAEEDASAPTEEDASAPAEEDAAEEVPAANDDGAVTVEGEEGGDEPVAAEPEEGVEGGDDVHDQGEEEHDHGEEDPNDDGVTVSAEPWMGEDYASLADMKHAVLYEGTLYLGSDGEFLAEDAGYGSLYHKIKAYTHEKNDTAWEKAIEVDFVLDIHEDLYEYGPEASWKVSLDDLSYLFADEPQTHIYADIDLGGVGSSWRREAQLRSSNCTLPELERGDDPCAWSYGDSWEQREGAEWEGERNFEYEDFDITRSGWWFCAEQSGYDAETNTFKQVFHQQYYSETGNVTTADAFAGVELPVMFNVGFDNEPAGWDEGEMRMDDFKLVADWSATTEQVADADAGGDGGDGDADAGGDGGDGDAGAGGDGGDGDAGAGGDGGDGDAGAGGDGGDGDGEGEGSVTETGDAEEKCDGSISLTSTVAALGLGLLSTFF